MARKSIFEQLSGIKIYKYEIAKIHKLLDDRFGIQIITRFPTGNCTESYISVYNFVDKYCFKQWKQRATLTNIEEMYTLLGLNFSPESDNSNDVLNHLEFYANIIYIVNLASLDFDQEFLEYESLLMAKSNLTQLLDWLNYEQKIFKKDQKVLLVQKNAATTAVSEIVDKETAYKVIEYNHYVLKGNLEAKGNILISLGKQMEAQRATLREINSDLEDNIFSLLNNLDLRHNNIDVGDGENKKYLKYVAGMKKNELEEWYDELYQMILLAYLELDNIDRSKKVKELDKKIKEAKHAKP